MNQTVLVTGATGLVGRALCQALGLAGHRVRTLSRGCGDYCWDVDAGQIEAGALDDVDCVVHLAGEPVVQRWTAAVKRRIMKSRVKSTELLVSEILRQDTPPAFICASGTNYYGYHTESPVDESSPSGGGFLAEVSREWEAAAQPLVDAGVRTAWVRTGMVLAAEGGAVAKLLPIFRLGLGGPIASGSQQISWISLSDLVAIFLHIVSDATLSGAVNAVAPHSVSNREFSRTLGEVLGRPSIVPVPAVALKVVYGAMAKETVLSSVSAIPRVLLDLGFSWHTPDLKSALRDCLKS